MLSNTEIYLIGLGFFLAILGAFLYFRKVSNSNKMLLKAKQANLKDFSYKSYESSNITYEVTCAPCKGNSIRSNANSR